jgi:DNA-binding NtrC family response regulator
MTTHDQSTAPVDDQSKAVARQLRLSAYINGAQAESLVLTQGKIRIGRSADNDLVIADPTVSSHHLEVHFTHGGLLVLDLATKNGTWYKGSRIREVLVPPGAVLTLGSAKLRVEGDAPAEPFLWGSLVCVAPSMRLVFQRLQALAPTHLPVRLCGERGTGKEVLARALHSDSPRAQRPLVTLECGACLPQQLEEELFGASGQPGPAFARACGGTLLLADVDTLPAALQVRLLDTLRAADARVLSLTRCSLDAELMAGRFHEGLRLELGRIELVLPPLRERREDIPALVHTFLSELSERAAGFKPSEDLLGALAEHPWPGNVRELRQVVEQAVGPSSTSQARAPSPGDYSAARNRALEHFERNFVLQLLQSHGNNVSRAAREAGISRIHLHRLIKKHGLT